MSARGKSQRKDDKAFESAVEKILRDFADRQRVLREELLALEREVAKMSAAIKQKKVKKFIDTLPL